MRLGVTKHSHEPSQVRCEDMSDRFDTDPCADEGLVAKVLLGDQSAARALVSRFAPLIRRVVSRESPREFREDFIQEVWAHLWAQNCRALQRWDRHSPLINYLAVVARNLVRDRMAVRRVPTEAMGNHPEPVDPDDPSHAIEVTQLMECLEKAKARLSQTHREIIRLRHELSLKHQEIAGKLGRSLGYVGTTLARAERYLRDEILESRGDHLGIFKSIFNRSR
jgi:RNA polymerase sigma factor (sigma-70 family)